MKNKKIANFNIRWILIHLILIFSNLNAISQVKGFVIDSFTKQPIKNLIGIMKKTDVR